MNERPYIICHMTTSIDGKVTGEFLSTPAGERASQVYYQINRDYQADGYACGRVTMQGSFCGTEAPDLSEYKPAKCGADYVAENLDRLKKAEAISA